MSGSAGQPNSRYRLIGDALALIRWCGHRHGEFTWRTLADDLGFGRRTAHRWLVVLEGHRVIERVSEARSGSTPDVYRSVVRLVS